MHQKFPKKQKRSLLFRKREGEEETREVPHALRSGEIDPTSRRGEQQGYPGELGC